MTTYNKPSNLLIYYGWLSGFNSAANGWSNEKVAQDIARYELAVLGAGIASPSHGDYANSSVIVPRVIELNPNCEVFGYITTNMTQSAFEDQVDLWDDMGVTGIFFDEAGYDYGTVATNGRDAVNDKVDYVHGKGLLCFMNAWNIDHTIGTTNDASYPNSTWNSRTKASKLNTNDYYLLESFAVNTAAYTGGLATPADWIARGDKAVSMRDTYGINLAAINVVNNTDTSGQAYADFAFTAACMYSLEANGSSDIYYGASSGNSALWEQPDVDMANPWQAIPSVVADQTAGIYWRYSKGGRFMVNFSTKASEVESY